MLVVLSSTDRRSSARRGPPSRCRSRAPSRRPTRRAARRTGSPASGRGGRCRARAPRRRLARLEEVVDRLGIGSGPLSLSVCARSRPSSSSITMYGMPSSGLPTSSTFATCSLLSFTAARASRTNRATTSGIRMTSRRRNFIATRSSSCRCVASTTMPMPPSPTMRSMRNFPASTCPGTTGGGSRGGFVSGPDVLKPSPPMSQCVPSLQSTTLAKAVVFFHS